MKNLEHYEIIATLFKYPDQQFLENVRIVHELFARDYPKAREELDDFVECLPANDLRQIEYLFTRSFDVQAITTLDVGYVLFGDDYKRGALLANINREITERKIPCNSELADHLPNVLKLIARLSTEEQTDPALKNDLVEGILAPAVEKMIDEFNDAFVEKKQAYYQKQHKTLIEAPPIKPTLYRHALRALYQVFVADFAVQATPQSYETSGFLASIGKEIKIEKEFNPK